MSVVNESEAAVYRVFEALDELVALIETARGMPMSSSCVIPRATALDLLDDVRESLPRELDDAQVVLGNRDDLLAQARDELSRSVERAQTERDRLASGARSDADGVVRAAREKAAHMTAAAKKEVESIIAEARAEHDRLLAETEVYRSARQRAQQLVAEAEAEATRKKSDADDYVENKLGAFAQMLDYTLRSVQKGREALRERGASTRPPSVRRPPRE